MKNSKFLLAITIVSAVALGPGCLPWREIVIAQPAIEPELTQKFKKLLPEATEFKAVVKGEEVVYYKAYNKAGKIIGSAFIAEKYAFTDRLEIIGIVDLDYWVASINVERHPEYRGNLEIIDPKFETQFVGLSMEELHLSPNGKVNAVTGATISSNAVVEAVRKRIEEIKRLP